MSVINLTKRNITRNYEFELFHIHVLKINQAYRIGGQDKGDDIVRNNEDFEHHVFRRK